MELNVNRMVVLLEAAESGSDAPGSFHWDIMANMLNCDAVPLQGPEHLKLRCRARDFTLGNSTVGCGGEEALLKASPTQGHQGRDGRPCLWAPRWVPAGGWCLMTRVDFCPQLLVWVHIYLHFTKEEMKFREDTNCPKVTARTQTPLIVALKVCMNI